MMTTSIPRKIIQKILEAGVRAPSGENCQPWRFEVYDNKIDIFNIPEKDLSLYNFRQRGSLIAHGALLENVAIASAAMGYHAGFTLFPDKNNSNLVAIITLEKTRPIDDPLFLYINERSTNRKPYEATPLTPEQKKELLQSTGEVGEGEIRLVEDFELKKSLAQALAVSDRLLFENRKLHDFLFSHISWTKEEALERKSGFYVKEMELSPPQEKAFKLFRNWNILNFFNKFGFSKMAAKGNIKLYARVGAIGAIVVKNNTPVDFVTAGRIMQRVWLKAAKMGLSIQPVTGIIFFIQRILAGEAQDFSTEQVGLIKSAYKNIAEAFGVQGKTIAMLFRIGYSGEPSARSLRLPPNVAYKIK